MFAIDIKLVDCDACINARKRLKDRFVQLLSTLGPYGLTQRTRLIN